MKRFGIEITKDLEEVLFDHFVKVINMKKDGNNIIITGYMEKEDIESHREYIIIYNTKTKQVIDNE